MREDADQIDQIDLGLFNMVKPDRTEPNKNKQYGLVLVHNI